LAAGLGHRGGFRLHFSTGAVGVELERKLRAIGFICVGAERGESSNSGDREETGSRVHGANPWIKSVSKKAGTKRQKRMLKTTSNRVR
jgi:hypothetical protein